MLSALKPADPFLRNHKVRDGISKALVDAMASDPSIHLFGEGAQVKMHYDAPEIEQRFPDRVHTLPIGEDGNTNFAVGVSLVGIKPVVDVIGSDFLYRTLDSICNTAAKHNTVIGPQQTKTTMVIRAEFLTGGPTSGQRLEALFTHIPGLRVVVPSTPRDAYGLMRSALATPGVTIFFEDREIDDGGPFTESDLETGDAIPIGALQARQLGITGTTSIFTYGVMRQRVERVLSRQKWLADVYEEPNLRASLYDLRTLYPLDWDGIKWAIDRAPRALVVEPDVTYGGIGAELVAQIAERRFRDGVQVKRLGAKRVTIPASAAVNQRMLPSEEEIFDAITTGW